MEHVRMPGRPRRVGLARGAAVMFVLVSLLGTVPSAFPQASLLGTGVPTTQPQMTAGAASSPHYQLSAPPSFTGLPQSFQSSGFGHFPLEVIFVDPLSRAPDFSSLTEIRLDDPALRILQDSHSSAKQEYERIQRSFGPGPVKHAELTLRRTEVAMQQRIAELSRISHQSPPTTQPAK